MTSHNSSSLWTCPSCTARGTGKFCSQCGEKHPDPESLSLRHFFEATFESLFHADGRLWSTVRSLIASPGELTCAFIEGSRKKYIGPIQLFLLANLVYFFIQSLTGWNTFSTPLLLHVTDLPYRSLAKQILDHRLAALNLTYEQYEPVFNHAVALHAKSLVILLIPLFTPLVALFFWRRRPRWVIHLTFASHFMAFNLLLMCVLQPATSLVVTGLVKLGAHPTWIAVDHWITYISNAGQFAYLFLAARRVYGQRWFWTAPKAILLVIGFGYPVIAFRFILFLITLYAG